MGITLRHVNILSKNDRDHIPTDIHSSESKTPHSTINRNDKSQILARLLILVGQNNLSVEDIFGRLTAYS